MDIVGWTIIFGLFIFIFYVLVTYVEDEDSEGSPPSESSIHNDAVEKEEEAGVDQTPNLTECPACGQDISEEAATCINCGHPFQDKTKDSSENQASSSPESKPDSYWIRALTQDFTEQERYQQSAAKWSAIGLFGLTFLGFISGLGLIGAFAGAIVCFGVALMKEDLGGKYLAFLVTDIILYSIVVGLVLYIFGRATLQQIGVLG